LTTLARLVLTALLLSGFVLSALLLARLILAALLRIILFVSHRDALLRHGGVEGVWNSRYAPPRGRNVLIEPRFLIIYRCDYEQALKLRANCRGI
jgi:hypothetical protein